MHRKLYSVMFAFFIFVWIGCGKEPSLEGPRIGITYGKIQTLALKVGIDINGEYRTALAKQRANSLPILVDDNPIVVKEKLDSIDGLLVPGGLDVEPSRYGEEKDERCEAVDEKLDALEYAALAHAREKRLPVLGICRGEQILNVFYGGSLYQDIPSQYKSASPVQHRDQLNLWIYKHARECFHDVTFTQGSALGALLGTKPIRVNTYHHQGVKKLAPGFVVTARSSDGFVEAIERPGEPFIIGVQFHPEMLRESDPRFSAIFKAFLDDVKKRKRGQGR